MEPADVAALSAARSLQALAFGPPAPMPAARISSVKLRIRGKTHWHRTAYGSHPALWKAASCKRWKANLLAAAKGKGKGKSAAKKTAKGKGKGKTAAKKRKVKAKEPIGSWEDKDSPPEFVRMDFLKRVIQCAMDALSETAENRFMLNMATIGHLNGDVENLIEIRFATICSGSEIFVTALPHIEAEIFRTK